MSKFATDTKVSPEKTRQEIEKTLKKYGATGFFYASEDARVILGFRAHERLVQFSVPIPKPSDFLQAKGRRRTKVQMEQASDQAIRTRWRCLSLAIKAKLEVVESGICSFEQEFLGYILTANGKTVADQVIPMIEQEYKTGKPMRLTLGSAP